MMPAPQTLLRLTASLAAMSPLLSSLELFRRRDLLQDRGLLSWRIHRLRKPRLTRILARLGIARLLPYPHILGLLWLRVAAAVSIPALALAGISPLVPLVVLIASNALFTLRNPAANDGADQLSQITLLTCALAESIHTPHACTAALIFLAAQSALAYATSGWLKAPHRDWYTGRYLLQILSTALAGDRSLWHSLSARPTLARACGALVVLTDCTLSLAALFPPHLCLAILAAGVLLHLAIARVMGLNTFVWAFVATYPAVWFASCLLHPGAVR